MRYRLEYALAWVLIKFVGALPRPLARAAGISIVWLVYLLHRRLGRVGLRNLELAFPEKSLSERGAINRHEWLGSARTVVVDGSR